VGATVGTSVAGTAVGSGAAVGVAGDAQAARSRLAINNANTGTNNLVRILL
jgi:hypothetical protein